MYKRQLHRFGPGSLPGLLACLLHTDAGFAPKLFPAAALHLSLLADPQQRLIRVAVYTQNVFLIIRVENYCTCLLYTSCGSC